MRVDINGRLLSFVLVFLLLVGGIGVSFALSAGTVPNPGHGVDGLGAPSGCTSGQVLKWSGSVWECKDDDDTISASGPSASTGSTCELYGPFGKFPSGTYNAANGNWDIVTLPSECIGGVCMYILKRDRLGSIKTEMRQMYMDSNGRWARDVSGTSMNKVNGDSNEYRLMSIDYDGAIAAALDDDRTPANQFQRDKGKVSVYTRKSNYETTLTICY